MRNKKLFTLISIILILSLILIGCGEKSDVNENEVEGEKTIEEDEKDILESQDEDLEEDIEENIEEPKEDTEVEVKENKEEDASVSKSNTSNKDNKEETNKQNTKSNIDNKSLVTIAIIGSSDIGTILDTTEVEIKDGDTVFDILKQVVKDNSIQMEYKGRKSNVYVQGIHNIYEFDNGPESGWIFRVNGEVSQKSSGAYKLSNGDKIEWLYTTDLGKEFGAEGGGQ